MEILESNRDALLISIPMLAGMLAGFFRLDELFSRPRASKRKRRMIGREFSCLDERGVARCIEPDGRHLAGDSRSLKIKLSDASSGNDV
jgi:hypothetical protein